MDRYIGRLLDNRYEILEIIGTGGMAVVYKARCHRLNRLVAIKILKDEFSRDEEFRRRFHAEGEAVAMLSHPNIVQVYDVSSTDNANFIVMELIDGITLKQYMEKKGVLNWKETLHFGMQIAKALEHAHGRSIVHRDIKPHNVMVLKNGSVKVTDFGIARVMSKSNTLTKEALGSVHYISPEQAKGGWVDNRSDLYSLGVVMYEMMTGRPPYDGESPVAVAIQHINGGATMPSSLNPNIPGGMEQIIMKAMALDPKDRYLSATEMLKDMEEFRKDPTILFNQPKTAGIDGATRVIQTAAVAEAARQPRTTAEKIAGVPSGTQRPRNTGSLQQSRPAGTQQPRTTGSVPRQPRTTGEVPRQRAAGTSRPQSGAARTGSAEAARRTAPARSSQPPRKTREEIQEEETRNRIATISIVACSVVAIIAIIVFLVVLVNGGLLDKSQNLVTVPNMENKYYETALKDYQGFEIELYDQRYDEIVEKGKIISQEPAAGEEVVQGTVIKVVVSLGPEPVVKVMENLTRQDYETAVKFLENLDMGLNPLQRQEFHDEIEEGKVIRTEPAVGETLEEGQTIWIYVSSGPAIETAEVKNVVGKKEETARSILNEQGFTVIETEPVFDEEDEGVVIKQSVTAGTKLDVTTKIILTVSKGPEKAKMINVVGQQYDAAYENLTDLGFKKVTRKDVESSAEAGEVVEQSVSKGTELALDKEIILSVSKGPAPTDAPTQAPTQAPITEVTIRKTFSLPADRTEDYVLSLYQNGMNVYEDTQITAGTTSITVELTGSGTQYYDLYINDEYYKTEKVVFTANG
ncbi:MAG: Stk1 family PASTA domain-containing Ser/Thr kinase [Oscillospiraceae bacterium]|nr:Stk1 family PASTA domain-containing Ser/Thr kinase [Oscillospiraceae bacterium]